LIVSDLVEDLIALMDSPAEVTAPTNLGNPNEFRVIERAKLVLQKTGSRAGMEKRPLPPTTQSSAAQTLGVHSGCELDRGFPLLKGWTIQ